MKAMSKTRSPLTAGGVEVLAASLQALDRVFATRMSDTIGHIAAGMLMRVFQVAAVFDVLGVVIGVHDLVHRTADDGLRLCAFGDDDRFQTVFAGSNPAVLTDEIEIIRAMHQQLSHDGIVVFVLAEVTVVALFGAVLAAHCVRHVGREGDAAQSVTGDRLLLNVDRLAVVVVAADMHGTRGTHRADAVLHHVAVFGEHVNVVAQRLKVVRRVVTTDVTFVVQTGHLHVRSLHEMAAVAA